jgi:5'-3' exonuclease
METQERSLLLVDVSHHCYRQSAAHPQLSARGMFTGGLYGFVVAVAKAVRETDATHAVFGLDWKPYLRSYDYPQYKQVRKSRMDPELKERAAETQVLVLGMLGECGLATWGVQGFEYDDLVGHAVRKYRHRFGRMWAMSNDSDLNQLLYVTDRFAVLRGALGDAYRRKDLLRDCPGLSRDEWLTMHAMMGTHNDVEGIPRVGPKTALSAVRTPGKMRAYREAHGELIERNRRLIELPHRELPWSAAMPLRSERGFDARAFYRFLSAFDIDVRASIERPWRRIGGEL